MRTLFIGGALGVVVVLLAACSSSDSNSTSERAIQRQADLYAIDQIERKFHRATSKHDIDLMMSLWAPNATFTAGETVTGKKQIRQFWLSKSKLFQPTTHWVSDTAAYKIRITVNGDRGTLNFECHYIDVKTKKVVVITEADMEVGRINERWLITSLVGGSAATLSP